jgi:outer membrane protein OmpA-like peptidoglycan-associated protein
MALHAAQPRPVARLGWWAAVLMFPLVFAAIGTLWPAPQALHPSETVAPVPAPLDPGPLRVTMAAALASAGSITFPADRADLAGPSATAVERVAHLLGTGPGPQVAVTGFAADAPGPAEVAQRLSERRAAVVADALVAAGVERDRIVVAGRGTAEPLTTPAQSRRVEVALR